jgi:hypothetical protein
LANAEERRQSDLPLAQFVHCEGDFLCDPQGRPLSWIIPVALPASLPKNVNIYVVARALAQDGQPNDPLIVLGLPTLERRRRVGPFATPSRCRMDNLPMLGGPTARINVGPLDHQRLSRAGGLGTLRRGDSHDLM